MRGVEVAIWRMDADGVGGDSQNAQLGFEETESRAIGAVRDRLEYEKPRTPLAWLVSRVFM